MVFGLLAPLACFVPIVRRKVIPSFVHLSLRMLFKTPELSVMAAAEAKPIEFADMIEAESLAGSATADQHAPVELWARPLILIAALNTLRALWPTYFYVEQHEGRDPID